MVAWSTNLSGSGYFGFTINIVIPDSANSLALLAVSISLFVITPVSLLLESGLSLLILQTTSASIDFASSRIGSTSVLIE